MDKDLLKVTLINFNKVGQELPDEYSAILSELMSIPNNLFEKLNLNYTYLYELDFKTSTTLFFSVFPNTCPLDRKTEEKELQTIFSDPEKLAESFCSSLEDDLSKKKTSGTPNETERIFLASVYFNCIFASYGNIQSILLHKKGLSICELIAQARENNDSKSLFEAIAVDKCCINTPTSQKMILDASLLKDEAFFIGLRKAISRSRPHKSEHDNARLMARLQRDINPDNPLSQEDICDLFINQLKIYPNDGKDPCGSLWRFIQRLKGDLH